MPKIQKPLFFTNPHGAQALRYTEDKSMRVGQSIGNQLFTLYVPGLNEPYGEEGFQVTMTGEELDSLCQQWIAFCRKVEK